MSKQKDLIGVADGATAVPSNPRRSPTTRKSWLPRREAAEYMGIHPRTLANWAAVGRGPRYSKPSGSSCMYRVEDLDAYLDAHMVHTDEQPEAA
ncbi:helix-turn-helix domain-containing protein [Nocardia aurantiaca]|nr:helix-turn-helix domain-containing protein [Nocardia aurantiaca]